MDFQVYRDKKREKNFLRARIVCFIFETSHVFITSSSAIIRRIFSLCRTQSKHLSHVCMCVYAILQLTRRGILAQKTARVRRCGIYNIHAFLVYIVAETSSYSKRRSKFRRTQARECWSGNKGLRDRLSFRTQLYIISNLRLVKRRYNSYACCEVKKEFFFFFLKLSIFISTNSKIYSPTL